VGQIGVYSKPSILKIS